MGYIWEEIPEKYKPHWKSWKIEGTPYEDVQKRLKAKGLNNPWLRNDVWIYSTPNKSTSIPRLFKRGLLPGFVLFLGALTIERFPFPKDDSKHH